MIFSELMGMAAAASTGTPILPFDPSLISSEIGMKEMRKIVNVFLRKFNVVEKTIDNSYDTDWLWPRAYASQVKSVLKETDDLDELAIRVNLNKSPLVGSRSISKVMMRIGELVPIHKPTLNVLGNQLNFQSFQNDSNEQIKRNIEIGNRTIISRAVDRNIGYMYDYVAEPLKTMKSHVEFYYPHPDMGEYMGKKEAEKVTYQNDGLNLDFSEKQSQSSVKEIAWLRHTRHFAGTLCAIYHLQKKSPSVDVYLKDGIAPTARCTLSIDDYNNKYDTSYFVQMGEWDTGLDSVGRKLVHNDDIHPDLEKEVHRNSKIIPANDAILSNIERLTSIEERICNSQIFSFEKNYYEGPIIKELFDDLLHQKVPEDDENDTVLKEILSKIQEKQNFIENTITPKIRKRIEPQQSNS